MTSVLLLFLAGQSATNLTSQMQAYYDKLGMADRLNARVEIVSKSGEPVFEQVWLEKPMRMRVVSDASETRIDGADEWFIDRKAKTYQKAGRTEYWCPPAFEPFFNHHHFNQAQSGTWSYGKSASGKNDAKVPALVLTSTVPGLTDGAVYVDPRTLLPLGFESKSSASERYVVLDLQLDPKWKFDWPPLTGFTEVKTLP